MVVSFPPADPSDESSETLAPVTSLFARRATAAAAPDPDGWFAGEPDDQPAPVVAPVERPVAPVRRLPVSAPADEPAVGQSPPSAPTVARAPERARVAWTPVAEPDANASSAQRFDDEATEAPEEPVDPEVRLAELDLLAVRKLARRGCSEWEIAELLRGHDAEPHEVEHTLEELRRRGYLDDAELARQLVESLHNRKGQSRAVIGRELSARRIEQSIAAEALEAIDDDDELRRALVVAEKRAGQLRSLDQATAERRLSAYLARRGYGSSVIREACSRALSGNKRSGVTFR